MLSRKELHMYVCSFTDFTKTFLLSCMCMLLCMYVYAAFAFLFGLLLHTASLQELWWNILLWLFRQQSPVAQLSKASQSV